MSDLIDRQAAIDKIGETSDEIYKIKQKGATYPHDDFFQGMAYAENIVKQLPPAQPKRGKWIYQIGMVKCDQCLRAIRRIDHDGLLNFCPNCGADMREVTT